MKKTMKSIPPEIQSQAEDMMKGLQQARQELTRLKNHPSRRKKRADGLHAMCLDLKKQLETAKREQDAQVAAVKKQVDMHRHHRPKAVSGTPRRRA